MNARTLTIIASLLLGLGLATLAVAAFFMQDRLDERDNPMVYFQEPLPFENFEWKRVPVSLTLVEGEELPTPDPTAQDGAGDQQRLLTDLAPTDTMALRLDFRGESVYFPLRIPTDRSNFPGAVPNERLDLIESWFKILQFVDGVSNIEELKEGLEDGTVSPRIVIAARYQPPGLNPTWAAVQRQNWLYRFAELKLEGDDPIVVTESTYRELDALGTPGRRADPDLIPDDDQRAERLWMHYVMQQVTPPKFFRAKDRDLDLALDAMGWTWPAALAGGFASVLSVIVFGFAAKSRRLA